MTGRQRPLGKAPDARSELGRARDELEQAGGQFAEARFWLAGYRWKESAATAARYQRVRGPLAGPASAIVRAVDADQVEAKLRGELGRIGLELVAVIFAEPWAAGALLVG